MTRLKSAKNAQKKKNCNKGYSCGAGCVQRGKKCRHPLDDLSSQSADWLVSSADRLTSPPAVQKTSQGSGAIDPPGRLRLAADHVVSANPLYTAEAFDRGLDQIQSPGGAQRAEKLRQFLQNQDIQLVVYDANLPQAEQLEAFRQGIKYKSWADDEMTDKTIPKDDSIEGFTNAAYNHVVLRVDGNGQPFRPDANELQTTIEVVFMRAESDDEDNVAWGIRSPTYSQQDGQFITYLHEMGHQIHYSAGKPIFPEESAGSLTEYGASSANEWFAEHFAAWMLDAQGYSRLDPVGARFIEESLDQAIQAPRRLQ